MLLANISVAEKILECFPASSVLRRHPAPTQKMLGPLVASLRSIGVDTAGMDASSSRSLNACLDGCVRESDEYFNKLVRIIATRCMTQAQYFSSGDFIRSEFKHYGLAMPVYTHFTSPIRRYADVCVHRILEHIIEARRAAPVEGADGAAASGRRVKKKKVMRREERRGGRPAAAGLSTAPGLPTQASLQLQARYCNQQKLAAKNAQDASNRLFMCLYIKSRKRRIETAGVLVGVGKKALDVFLPEFGFDRRIAYVDIVARYAKARAAAGLRSSYEGAPVGAVLRGVRVAHDPEARAARVVGAFGEDGEVVEVTMLRLEVLAQVTCELSVKTHPHLPMDIRASILL